MKDVEEAFLGSAPSDSNPIKKAKATAINIPVIPQTRPNPPPHTPHTEGASLSSIPLLFVPSQLSAGANFEYKPRYPMHQEPSRVPLQNQSSGDPTGGYFSRFY